LKAAERSNSVLMTVVIPTIGQSAHLRGLLERLQRQNFGNYSSEKNFVPHPRIEVLVIANLPSQDLRNLVSSLNRHPLVRFEYLETGKIGVNLARNKGLGRAQGEVILFLDDDAILAETAVPSELFLAQHFQRHLEYPDAIALGGPYRLVGLKTKWDLAYHHIANHWIQMNRRGPHQTQQLLGGNVSFKAQKLRSLNEQFDESIPYGGSETGLCQRLHQADQTLLYFDDLAIGHATGLQRLDFMKKAFLQGAGAAWRQTRLGRARLYGPHSFDPRPQVASLIRPISLFDSCFEFGCESHPFHDDLTNNSRVSFSYTLWVFFLIRRQIWRFVKSGPAVLLRSCYSATRSIWITSRFER
jgi:glycosyltransferase involved in cell wall biosynthesis